MCVCRSSYYRGVIFYACGGACAIGLLVTVALIPIKVGKRRGQFIYKRHLEKSPSNLYYDRLQCTHEYISVNSFIVDAFL